MATDTHEEKRYAIHVPGGTFDITMSLFQGSWHDPRPVHCTNVWPSHGPSRKVLIDVLGVRRALKRPDGSRPNDEWHIVGRVLHGYKRHPGPGLRPHSTMRSEWFQGTYSPAHQFAQILTVTESPIRQVLEKTHVHERLDETDMLGTLNLDGGPNKLDLLSALFDDGDARTSQVYFVSPRHRSNYDLLLFGAYRRHEHVSQGSDGESYVLMAVDNEQTRLRNFERDANPHACHYAVIYDTRSRGGLVRPFGRGETPPF